jgi:hypothetical protein
MNQYLLKPRPPRSLALAALLVVLGGVCCGVALTWPSQWGWWVACGVTAGVGLLLLVLGLTGLRRRRVWVELDDAGYAIYTSSGEYTGAWRDVTSVDISKHKDKLALRHGDKAKTVIAHPAGVPDAEFQRLRRDIDRYVELGG